MHSGTQRGNRPCSPRNETMTHALLWGPDNVPFSGLLWFGKFTAQFSHVEWSRLDTDLVNLSSSYQQPSRSRFRWKAGELSKRERNACIADHLGCPFPDSWVPWAQQRLSSGCASGNKRKPCLSNSNRVMPSVRTTHPKDIKPRESEPASNRHFLDAAPVASRLRRRPLSDAP